MPFSTMVRCFALALGGAVLLCGSPSVPALADDAGGITPIDANSSLLPGQTSAPNDTNGLGPLYSSQSAGIAFHPPAGLKALGRVDADHLAEWNDDSRHWVLKLSRIALKDPRPLQTVQEPGGRPLPGMIDDTIARLKQTIPNATVLRQDVSSIASAEVGVPDADPSEKPKPNVGLIAVRYTIGAQRYLAQQALIRANEVLYYVLTLTTPGSGAKADQTADDANERAAVDSFQKMLDTVHLLDRSKIRHDQDERLYRTRSFYVNLSPAKLREALIPEQWFRIQQDGHDVGYSYVVEELAGGLPQPDEDAIQRARSGSLTPQEKAQLIIPPKITPGDDILIGIRSRITLNGMRSDKTVGPVQTDSETWMFLTTDRKHEDWSRLVISDDSIAKKKTFSEELGSSDEHLVGLKSGATLSVSQVANAVNLPPFSMELPPYYLPQALAHLLPWVLPIKEAKTYAFASFVGSSRAVMMRYVDVGTPQQVELGGKLCHVVPISDRIGYDGSPTIHYLAADAGPDGKHAYLGNSNSELHLTVLSTDAATLQKIWANANLSRPGAVPAPVGPAAQQQGESSTATPQPTLPQQ